MPNAPLMLSDNLFDNTVLHPTFTVANAGGDDVTGQEAFRVADNLRDLTSWSPSTPNVARSLYADSGGSVPVSVAILDRGHDLLGVTVTVGVYTSSALSSAVGAIACTIPSTPGGLPSDANGCLTPDGVWWKTFNTITGRVPALTIPGLGTGVVPTVTGLYMGSYYRFPDFLNAPAAYDYKTDVKFLRNEVSRGGVRVKSRPLNFAKLPFSCEMEPSEYATFEPHLRTLIQYNAPWWFCLDDSDTTLAGLLRLYQVPGDITYDPQANPVHREIRAFELEEVLPRLYL